MNGTKGNVMNIEEKKEIFNLFLDVNGADKEYWRLRGEWSFPNTLPEDWVSGAFCWPQPKLNYWANLSDKWKDIEEGLV